MIIIPIIFLKVIDVFIPKPFRSFAFVTFDDYDVAASLLGKDQNINGVMATVGSAVPKLPPTRQNVGNSKTTQNQVQSSTPSQTQGTNQWTGLLSYKFNLF